MKKSVFSGTATALITPFSADGRDIDFSSFEKLINFQLKCSVDALVVSGTTGEAPVLSSEEKIELIRCAKKLAGQNTPVIAGTGSNNTEEAVRKSNDAEKEGVDGLLIVTPYYNKCSDESLIKHYYYIADRVSTPIIVYNVPSRTGVNIKADLYKILAEHRNIVAVKEASGNVSEFNKAVSLTPELDFYSGNDDQTVSMMAYGAKGLISVASNIIPAIMKRITDLCLQDKFAEAAELHKRYLKLLNILFCEINPAPVKSACKEVFGTNNVLRLPLCSVNRENETKIQRLLTEYNIINTI